MVMHLATASRSTEAQNFSCSKHLKAHSVLSFQQQAWPLLPLLACSDDSVAGLASCPALEGLIVLVPFLRGDPF